MRAVFICSKQKMLTPTTASAHIVVSPQINKMHSSAALSQLFTRRARCSHQLAAHFQRDIITWLVVISYGMNDSGVQHSGPS